MSGIKVDGNIIREEPALTVSGSKAWQETFNRKAFDDASAQIFLNNLGSIGDCSPTHPPCYFDLERSMHNKATPCLEAMVFLMSLGLGLGLLLPRRCSKLILPSGMG